MQTICIVFVIQFSFLCHLFDYFFFFFFFFFLQILNICGQTVEGSILNDMAVC